MKTPIGRAIRFITSALAASLLTTAFAMPPAAQATAPRRIALYGGLPVQVALESPITSGSAKAGDIFALRAAQAVIVDGYVLIPNGAEGQGEVVSAESAGSNGHPGSLTVQYDWIMSADGLKVKLSNTPETSQGDEKKGAASTMTIVGYATLGIAGLFAHNLVRGSDAVIDTTKKLTAYVDHTVHIAAIETASNPNDGYAH